MAKKPKPPKTFKEVEDYIREKGFCVDPQWFLGTFSAADWYDTNGKPILSWKQKLWNLDKLQRSWGKAHPCTFSSCKKPGVYDDGRDRDGHPMYRCIEHKRKFKPKLPAELTSGMKSADVRPVNANNERNRQARLLKEN